MSVYTSISDNEFSEILKNYSLGDFIHARGIQAGIENTNYFISTTEGEYVFTLFETINSQELAFYILLLQEAFKAGIACPQPQLNIQKQIINEIKGKPYIFVSRLKGQNLTSVNINQVKAISCELAKFHNLSFSLSTPANNRRGKTWRNKTAEKLMNKLSEKEAELLKTEIQNYESFDDSLLPKGIIHSDLFKDNALFEENEITGLIDFYDACYDTYLYDVAVTVNDWCTDEEGNLVKSYANTFLQNYQTRRPFTDDEKKAWPMMLRIAAMRFWLSRLEDSYEQKTGDLTHLKCPNVYKRILQNHILNNN